MKNIVTEVFYKTEQIRTTRITIVNLNKKLKTNSSRRFIVAPSRPPMTPAWGLQEMDNNCREPE